mgnify:CR=1 FL=1|tara:strand:+ start:2377 stop:3411 length:1035 start_codon:yes stop_codon:yes gene_type:complete
MGAKVEIRRIPGQEMARGTPGEIPRENTALLRDVGAFTRSVRKDTTMNVDTIDQANMAELPKRLRDARAAAGLSRAKAGEIAGVSPRSIEKYEYGTQEPPISKIRILAKAYDIPLDQLFTAPDDESATPKEHGKKPDAPDNKPATAPVDGLQDAAVLLAQLDEAQKRQFEGAHRRALSMIADLEAALYRIEPDELTQVADERSVHLADCKPADDLLGLFEADPDAGQTACANIQARIVDTGVLGADLFAIERDALADLATELEEEHEIERPAMLGFGWGDHEELVPVLRPLLRRLAIAGSGIDFDDRELFPRREEVEDEGRRQKRCERSNGCGRKGRKPRSYAG